MNNYPNLDIDKALSVARKAALSAAEVLQDYFTHYSNIKVQEKSGGEPVTNADLKSEAIIRKHISKIYPEHDIAGEEGGLLDKKTAFRWHIDPLDGTGNFIRGNPDFAISIALAWGNDVLVGVIVAPTKNIVFEARKCRGAFKNTERLKVSDNSNVKKAPIVWCKGHERDSSRSERLRVRIERRGAKLFHIGSAALECAAVATATASAYFTTHIHPWDVAAGKLLVEEAGGKVTNFKGEPYRLETDDFLASNGKIHKELMMLLSAPGN